MSGDIIALIIIVWVVVAGVMVFGMAEEDFETHVYVMMVFWPVVLPILAFFGFFYAIWSALRVSIGMFRSNGGREPQWVVRNTAGRR